MAKCNQNNRAARSERSSQRDSWIQASSGAWGVAAGLLGILGCMALGALFGAAVGVKKSLLIVCIAYAIGYETGLLAHILCFKRAPVQMGLVWPDRDGNLEETLMVLSRLHRLTLREHEVFSLLARGHALADVALELGITLSTARVHARNIHDKLRVSSNEELIELVNESSRGVTREQVRAAAAAPPPRRPGRPRKLDAPM